MMRLSSQAGKRTTEIELSMTSMIDVVFLLLIFFMVTTSFRKTERELDPAVKSQQSSGQSSENNFEPVIVEVLVAGSATVYRIGSATYETDGELRNILRQFSNKADGAYVKAADNASYGAAARALQACKSAGFPAVSFIPWDGKLG
ncbi:MAG: biopolymer transporter ExbD [Pirellulaceae bacterium]